MADLEATFCFERCNRGPVVGVNDKLIEHATYEKVKEELYNEIERIGKLI